MNGERKTDSVKKSKLVLERADQFGVVVDRTWFTVRNESVHGLDEWLNPSFDSATEV